MITNPFSRQQPIPGRGGPGDLGSPATWAQVPLAQVAILSGSRSGGGSILMARGKGLWADKPQFEPAGTDFAQAIQRAADRAKGTNWFNQPGAQAVLQAYDGQLYIASLVNQMGMGFPLEGEAGLFNPIVSRVEVAKLHPALQAVVGKKVMVDLRADLPQPLPPGGTVPYAPTPGVPQLPMPTQGAPGYPQPGVPVPGMPPSYPPQPPTPDHGGSWWERLTGAPRR